MSMQPPPPKRRKEEEDEGEQAERDDGEDEEGGDEGDDDGGEGGNGDGDGDGDGGDQTALNSTLRIPCQVRAATAAGTLSDTGCYHAPTPSQVYTRLLQPPSSVVHPFYYPVTSVELRTCSTLSACNHHRRMHSRPRLPPHSPPN